MTYLSAAQTAEKWKLSERSVRNYCAHGQIPGAFLQGKTWNIPENAVKPERKNKKTEKTFQLLNRLREEKASRLSGGIYQKVQIELTYNSNHMEGSRLTHEQTRYIYETNTIGIQETSVNIDDIVETVNHFRCIDYVIDHAARQLSENMIKELHAILKSGTSDSRKDWFAVGDYKKLPNEVGGRQTTEPKQVHAEMKKLIEAYQKEDKKELDDLLEFHYRFELIHPFQDGNGRLGRLLLFKECLRLGIVPFIIEDDLKLYYYRGLAEWLKERGYLRDTCLTAQDRFREYLNYFQIPE